LDKELKRQIKEDEFATGLARALAWVQSRRDELRTMGMVLAVVALVVGGLSFFQARQRSEAHQAFAEALELYDAPVAAELPEGFERPAGLTVMPTAAEKHRRAAAAFDGVERRFSGTELGVRAKYYAALSRIESGDQAAASQARQALTEIAARRDLPLESSLARLAIAELERRMGAVDEAAEAYKQLLEDASLALPRDHVLMRLAQLLDEARRVSEARASYKRLAEEFPTSLYAPEARQRAAYLDAGA
jgi:tetratricopeptide (TPR) repeat protein